MRHTVWYVPTFQINVSIIIHTITAENLISAFGCILILSVVADYAFQVEKSSSQLGAPDTHTTGPNFTLPNTDYTHKTSK